MLQTISDLFYNRLSFRLQNILSRGWYESLARIDREADMVFMNYGWASPDDAARLALQPEDESNRYCAQLYHRVAAAVDLRGKDVLEVGSGRGGGASYTMRYLEPATMTGLELARSAVTFCRQHHTTPGLSFIQGSAENLQFPDASFDAVINVESSHCYEYMGRFVDSVYRVLRPGGYFLYTDHRMKAEVEHWRASLLAPGFTLIEEETINPGVVRALELDNARKQELIARKVPPVMRHFFREFAGIEGTHSQYATLKRGDKLYLRFVLQKPDQ